MSSELPPAGWYPNPDSSGGLRWWSGVGWTQYTREGGPAPAGTEPTTVLQPGEPTAGTESTTVLQPGEPTAGNESTTVLQPGEPAGGWGQQTTGWGQQPGGWGQPAAPTTPVGGYAPYSPAAPKALTASGMRPLNGMFADIGRIVRRAWLPILGISIAIWAAVTAVYVAAVLAFVDLDALARGFDLLSAQTSAETGSTVIDPEISAAFRDAFSALPPAGWAILITALTILLLLATTVQVTAVTRLGMDAAAGQPVTWGAGWRAAFTAGFRLFGYYLLLSLLTGLAWTVAAVVVVALWAVSPGVSVFVGLLALVALTVLSVWILGRLIPVIAQVVVGRHALRWSWDHTRGKFWAVLGRYLLWSIAASVIVNVIVSVLSIPLSFLVLGTATNSSASDQLGASLVLSLITLPVSMALTAVTLIGIVPIWRDLTDLPAYRAIDEQGNPVPTT